MIMGQEAPDYEVRRPFVNISELCHKGPSSLNTETIEPLETNQWNSINFLHPLHAKFFSRNIDMYSWFPFFILTWHRYLKSFLMENKDSPIFA